MVISPDHRFLSLVRDSSFLFVGEGGLVCACGNWPVRRGVDVGRRMIRSDACLTDPQGAREARETAMKLEGRLIVALCVFADH